MKITLQHLREHGLEFHTASCTRRWFNRHGLDWRKFIKEGYDHTELLEVGSHDPDLKKLLEFHGLSVV